MKVTKDQFKAFIKAYPNKLEIDTYYVPTPPVRTYNDYSKSDFIVAAIHLGEDMNGTVVVHDANGTHRELIEGNVNEYHIYETD
jgi:hypothetical protein